MSGDPTKRDFFDWGPRQLATWGFAFLAILVLAGEFHWDSDAGMLYGSMWVAQALRYLWQTRRAHRRTSRAG